MRAFILGKELSTLASVDCAIWLPLDERVYMMSKQRLYLMHFSVYQFIDVTDSLLGDLTRHLPYLCFLHSGVPINSCAAAISDSQN